MTILDSKSEYSKIDKTDLLKNVDELPLQLESAWNQVRKVVLPSYYTSTNKIIVSGMGGSAVSGDLAKTIVELKSKVPVFVLRNYNLPNFVDKDSLLIVLSYSGNTEETLEVLTQGINKKAKIIAITTGGKVAEIARSNKIPFYQFQYDTEPRQAFGYLFGALIGILNKVGFINIKDSEFKETVSYLRKLREMINPDVPITKNQAKSLAEILHNKIVVTMAGFLSPIAFRFKAQLNENSKQMAFYEILPEACHNFIVGLNNPELVHEDVFILSLVSKYDHKRVVVRQNAIEEILSKNNIKHDELRLDFAQSPLSEMLSFVYLLDYASYYLAILNNTDPRPVKNIKYLKDKLAASPWHK